VFVDGRIARGLPSSPEFPEAATTRLPSFTAWAIAASMPASGWPEPRLRLITDRPAFAAATIPAAMSVAGSRVPSPSEASNVRITAVG
jgi:hypothetical protein